MMQIDRKFFLENVSRPVSYSNIFNFIRVVPKADFVVLLTFNIKSIELITIVFLNIVSKRREASGNNMTSTILSL
jgi:hypothetical protein